MNYCKSGSRFCLLVQWYFVLLEVGDLIAKLLGIQEELNQLIKQSIFQADLEAAWVIECEQNQRYYRLNLVYVASLVTANDQLIKRFAYKVNLVIYTYEIS